MNRSMPKSKIIAELAEATKVDKKHVADVLDALACLAYREARNGFIVPGICKLKVATRKASKCRNPGTGRLMMIGEHEVLKILPVKKAKDQVVPVPEGLVKNIPEPEHRVSTTSASSFKTPFSESARPSPEFDVGMQEGSGQVLFECKECGGMVAAPVEEAGKQGACPFCGMETSIPAQDGNRQVPEGRQEIDTPFAKTIEDFITFVCQMCGQEIEAPIDMIGMEVNCPTCASELCIPRESNVPQTDVVEADEEAELGKPRVNKSSMTMRIDLSDMT